MAADPPPQQDLMAPLTNKQDTHDRIVGCLIGSAIGDAIGLYTEFLSAEVSAAAYPSRSFTLYPSSQATPLRRDTHRDPHFPGDWTDDTDHATLMLLSYLHGDGRDPDPRDFASRLSTWVDMGLRALDTLPLGLGSTVGSIVRSRGFLDDPERAARAHWERRRRDVAPNGSLMRTHPAGLFCLRKTVEETFQMAMDFSIVTHVDPRCVISCVIGSALVRGLVRREVFTEEDIDAMITRAVGWYERQDYLEGTVLSPSELQRHVQVQDLDDLKLDDAMKMGYVYKTLGSGIYLLRTAMRRLADQGDDGLATRKALFETLIVDLIMRGGDADTNACFAGALLGAFFGWEALPPHWRDGLRHGSWLKKKAEGLSILLGVGEGHYVGSEDADTALDGGRGFLESKQIMERFAQMLARITSRRRGEQAEAG